MCVDVRNLCISAMAASVRFWMDRALILGPRSGHLAAFARIANMTNRSESALLLLTKQGGLRRTLTHDRIADRDLDRARR